MIVNLDGAANVTLDGLVLDGGDGGSGRKVSFTVYGPDGAPAGNTVTNSEIRNSFFSCLLLGGERWTITNNHIHHCGMDTTYDHGIYFLAQHSLIAHNRIEESACFNIQNYTSPAPGKPLPDHNTYDSNVFGRSGCGFVLTHGTGLAFRGNLLLEAPTQGAFGGAAVHALMRGTAVIEANLFWRGGIQSHAGTDAGLLVQGNTLCQGRIETHQATVRDNRTSCEGMNLDAEIQKRVTGRSGGGPAPLPAPRNLRVVTRP